MGGGLVIYITRIDTIGMVMVIIKNECVFNMSQAIMVAKSTATMVVGGTDPNIKVTWEIHIIRV